ncbi:MAG: MmcQ/YjbR family DNA-binding protein [Flavobacteriales bacterium]|nr:MmcQ/YjbR family DNA-binding protein [Flavobacteriales bacterium]
MDSQTARAMALHVIARQWAWREGPLWTTVGGGAELYSVKKRTYLTLWVEEHRAVMKLTPEQQALLGEEHPDAFAPIEQKLGKHGWTSVFMAHTSERLFRYAMDLAWRNVAPKWLIPTRAAPPKG